jgi:hypothetical protein
VFKNFIDLPYICHRAAGNTPELTDFMTFHFLAIIVALHHLEFNERM